jgi:hypothetical protein
VVAVLSRARGRSREGRLTRRRSAWPGGGLGLRHISHSITL